MSSHMNELYDLKHEKDPLSFTIIRYEPQHVREQTKDDHMKYGHSQGKYTLQEVNVKDEPDLISIMMSPGASVTQIFAENIIDSRTALEMNYRNQEEQSEVRSVNTSSNKFTCKVCKRLFSRRLNLYKHMAMHNSVEPYTYDMSGVSFSDRDTLGRHFLAPDEQSQFPCDVCKKWLPSKLELKKHMLSHDSPGPFECDMCDAKYSHKEGLVGHLSFHSQVPVFSCHMCDKTFPRRDILSEHLQTHREQGRLFCAKCDKSFIQRRAFLHHMELHYREDSVRCNSCNELIPKVQFHEHMALHPEDRRFYCDVCFASFQHYYRLKKHISLFHAEKQ